MKKNYFLNYFFALVVAMGMFSCSSSDDGDSAPENKPIAGVYTIDSYTLTFYDNSTFTAVDNSTSKNYTGAYTYNAPNLVLSVDATRAFSLEDGKDYTFTVSRSGNNLTLTNKETGESFTLNYVSEAPPSDGQLTPDQEKAYIKATARMLETYFVANEWSQLTDLVKELQDIDADALDGYFSKEIVSEIMTGTSVEESEGYRWERYDNNTGKTYYRIIKYVTTYEYYDRIIMYSQAKGQFEASYSGKKWAKTGSEDGLSATYTDSQGAVWVAKVTHSGSTGKIRLKGMNDDGYGWNSSTPYGNYEVIGEPQTAEGEMHIKNGEFIDVPTQVTATVTRNGEVKSQIVINISKFQNATDENSKLSLLGQSTGTVDVMLQPTGEAFNVHLDYDYANRANSLVNANIKRGNTELVNVAVSATPTSSESQKLGNVANVNATITVLNRLTAHVTATEGKSVYDAYDNAKKWRNRYNEEFVKTCASTINNGVNAYITNGPSSTINQGTVRVSVKSKEDYNGTRYELYPTLNFADGSSYAFEDYFTEAYFKSVIDYAKQLGKDVERMIKK